MDKQSLEFLVEAKKACYAGAGPRVAPFRPGANDLKYERDGLLYYDTYVGSGMFAGEEGLWVRGKPVWVMNYIGRLLEEGFGYSFLMEALRHATPEMPYRGPHEYSCGDLTYRCAVQGGPEWLSGSEEIVRRGVRVYECLFHGGAVK